MVATSHLCIIAKKIIWLHPSSHRSWAWPREDFSFSLLCSSILFSYLRQNGFFKKNSSCIGTKWMTSMIDYIPARYKGNWQSFSRDFGTLPSGLFLLPYLVPLSRNIEVSTQPRDGQRRKERTPCLLWQPLSEATEELAAAGAEKLEGADKPQHSDRNRLTGYQGRTNTK